MKSRPVASGSLSIQKSPFLQSTSAATSGGIVVPFFFTFSVAAFKFSLWYSVTLVSSVAFTLPAMLPAKAYVFIGLNAVRTLSIIALLLVFSSSILVMVDDIEAVNASVDGGSNSSSTINSDYIQNILNRLLIIGQTVVLILSELGWPAGFFDYYYFPVLGSDFGLGALGSDAMIGASVLSHFVKVFPLVSGFSLFSIGCLNMLIGLIFRERAKSTRSILSFRDRADDMLSSLDKTKETPFSKYRMDRDAEMGVGVKEPDTAHART
ncbi:uncharacterized protein HD556DRAFT_1409961 [Suillus plorans]|uniref:Uncharacterized protein n=1 Tax=Suillus plorans TaxID=116603 RepID=A0A9P7DCH5_9AGAM|nr:uncharacterized protein HD556DRAFT_1409961 [Suillus plorans]KAG1787252.1 hypothetical protein HD556DRAFT_1409961 [Suillus plorans]